MAVLSEVALAASTASSAAAFALTMLRIADRQPRRRRPRRRRRPAKRRVV